jgi:diguanylate cyclase (GGDEF)-like protein
MANQLEQQLKTWIDAFEKLSNAILESKSPKNYKEMFDFFINNFSCDQIFFWRKDFLKESNTRGQKQKFLSLNKTSLEEFDVLFKKFDSLQFNQRGCYFTEPYLYVKVHTDSEYYGFIFKEFPKDVLENEILMSFFLARLEGCLNLVDRFEKTQSLNFVDDVTGLYNQRYLSTLLDQEIERYKRANQNFSVLFIDVDHFKNVNDKNGHLVGSQILKEIGDILKKSVRAVDFCFRYGGDEFIIVLTGTDTEKATMVAERVCKTVRETSFLASGAAVNLTLSIGVACFPDHAQTKEKILQVADQAMYCGKNLSRNVVYLAS